MSLIAIHLVLHHYFRPCSLHASGGVTKVLDEFRLLSSSSLSLCPIMFSGSLLQWLSG